MDILLFVYLNGIWFLAGLLTGLTSFGGNLFAIPLLTLVMPARDAILFGCLSGTVIFLGLGFLYRREARWREIFLLGIATLPGVPLGVYFLHHAGSRLLLLAAGGSLALFLLWQFLAGRLHVAETPISRWSCLPFGFLSGIMMSAVGMGGPPLVLYAYLRHWGKESTICGANLAAAMTMPALLHSQWAAGLYSPQLLHAALFGALFGLFGIAASVPIVHNIDIRLFRRLLLLMIGLSACMLLVRGAIA